MTRMKIIFAAVQLLFLVSFYYIWKSCGSFSIKFSVSNTAAFEISNQEIDLQCPQKVNVVFIKTHKTASTTVQNILIRKGLQLGLTFVLPRSENIISQKHRFRANMISKPTNFTYNMMVHHARFNYDEVKKIMPNNTVFITILRDPVLQFESMFSYYDLSKHYKVAFGNLTWDSRVRNLKKRYSGWLGNNQMLYDLGYSGHTRDNRMIDDYIKFLDTKLDLVMIAERLDESLIILKSLLCWSTDDVLSFRLNTRSFRPQIPKSVEAFVRSINFADQRLYQNFSKRLDQRISKYGQAKMMEDSANLHYKNLMMEKLCHRELGKSKSHSEYKSPCWFMTRGEIELTRYLLQSQEKKYPFIRPVPLASAGKMK